MEMQGQTQTPTKAKKRVSFASDNPELHTFASPNRKREPIACSTTWAKTCDVLTSTQDQRGEPAKEATTIATCTVSPVRGRGPVGAGMRAWNESVHPEFHRGRGLAGTGMRAWDDSPDESMKSTEEFDWLHSSGDTGVPVVANSSRICDSMQNLQADQIEHQVEHQVRPEITSEISLNDIAQKVAANAAAAAAVEQIWTEVAQEEGVQDEAVYESLAEPSLSSPSISLPPFSEVAFTEATTEDEQACRIQSIHEYQIQHSSSEKTIESLHEQLDMKQLQTQPDGMIQCFWKGWWKLVLAWKVLSIAAMLFAFHSNAFYKSDEAVAKSVRNPMSVARSTQRPVTNHVGLALDVTHKPVTNPSDFKAKAEAEAEDAAAKAVEEAVSKAQADEEAAAEAKAEEEAAAKVKAAGEAAAKAKAAEEAAAKAKATEEAAAKAKAAEEAAATAKAAEEAAAKAKEAEEAAAQAKASEEAAARAKAVEEAAAQAKAMEEAAAQAKAAEEAAAKEKAAEEAAAKAKAVEKAAAEAKAAEEAAAFSYAYDLALQAKEATGEIGSRWWVIGSVVPLAVFVKLLL